MDCFSWDRLRKVTNLSDYDIVILNLLSLEDAGRLDSASFREMLDIQTAQEVLGKKDGAIFVLGDPRFSLKWQEPDGVHSEPFLVWTGIEFLWDDRHGDTVERSYAASGGSFKPFADKLARWSYSLAGCRAQDEEYEKVWNVTAWRDRGARTTVIVDTICENSYGNALVFSVVHGVDRYSNATNARALNSRQTDPLSGPVFFLPRSQLSEEATLEFVLRDLCGVDVSAPEPEWVSEFVAPGQEKVDSELAELEDRIQEMLEERERKVEEWTEVREPLKLLYQKGRRSKRSSVGYWRNSAQRWKGRRSATKRMAGS